MGWVLDAFVVCLLAGSALTLARLLPTARSPKDTFHNQPRFAFASVITCFLLLAWILVRTPYLVRDATLVYQVIISVIFAMALFGFLAILGKGLASKWETRLFCPHCGKFIRHNDEWKCGFCDTLNNTTLYRACVKCENEPKAYRCHECQGVIFLGEEQDARHVAVKKGVPVAQETEEQLKRRQQWEKDKREHELVITRLDAQLAQEKARLKLISQEEHTKLSALEKDFSETKHHFLGVHEIAARELKDAEVRYPNDPEMQDRIRSLVEGWKNNNI